MDIPKYSKINALFRYVNETNQYVTYRGLKQHAYLDRKMCKKYLSHLDTP